VLAYKTGYGVHFITLLAYFFTFPLTYFLFEIYSYLILTNISAAIRFLGNVSLLRTVSFSIIPRVICLKNAINQQKVAVATLGCKVNQYESALVAQELGADFMLVPFSSSADVYIINTCTVTAQADFQSRQLIRRARRRNPKAKIFVTGCYAEVSPCEINKIDSLSIILGNKQKDAISQIINNCATAANIRLPARLTSDENCAFVPLKYFRGRTRAFLKIQDGCDAFCSYCVIPYARNVKRSMPVKRVLDAAGHLADNNYREIVLTGIHLGAYGSDLSPQTDLESLLEELIRAGLPARFRLSSIEPREITDKLLALMEKNDGICPHLHIPLQSGDDKILRLMNRNYGASFYRSLIHKVASAVKDICIGADVIAGFPGEGKDEFNNTYRLLEELPLSYLHVFPYSDRPHTAAAEFSDKIPEKIKKERAHLLRQLSARKKTEFATRFLGKKIFLLVEKTKDKNTGLYKGFSQNYLQVLLENGRASSVNNIVEARIEKLSEGKIYGKIPAR